MSVHINAEKGAIADKILLPGDPLRAEFIANKYLENPVCYNKVRGMLGFTGMYKGERVSVQGTGMGLPSLSIYANELIREYDVKKLIRVGSCGSMQKDIHVRDIILAMSSSTNSSMNKNRFKGMDFAPTADFSLFRNALDVAKGSNLEIKAGNVLSSDSFYTDDPDEWKMWAAFNVLAVEMETSALYTLAAKYGVSALSILTVSDSLVTWEETSSEEREKTFTQMMELALDVIIKK
ncbi:purine-nucleoside phosphorylase [Thiospirochaeta perfilievii]|uniref:Uridine phosphorylase n=1 Tax=Thiospirochaeta perfilievii TaxID=252967 RepID=A0A5C1QGB6_9SPIO|nr:purine-nucleoside phosphorylase [Thiospirochaeta perfilievii]QEN06109.1 purine-nucleoside phosphorylase [Thiospirochaeta perfilievii]